MSDTNELINAWLKSKFLASDEYDVETHGEFNNVYVVSGEAGWECGCYSEYTRDDRFEMTAVMVGKSGNFEYAYGGWGDLPSFVTELAVYANNPCQFERDSSNWSW